MGSEVLHVAVSPLPGVPAPSILAGLAETLIEPFLMFDPVVDEGPALTVKSGVAPLVEHLTTRPSLSARGGSEFEAVIRWGNYYRPDGPVSTGAVSVFIDRDAVALDVALGSLLGSMQLLHAPFGFLDSGLDRFRARDNSHRDVYQEGKTGRIAWLGCVAG